MSRSRRRRFALVLLTALLFASAMAAPVVGTDTSAPSTDPDTPVRTTAPDDAAVRFDVAQQRAGFSTDNTLTRIRLYDNGTARWTVQVRTALDSESAVEQYRAFQAAFRNNSSEALAAFRDRLRGTVRTAADESGREMRATDFAISTSIQEVPRRWGVVTYRFTWTNFGVERGDAVSVGDAFGSGFYLSENDTLELVAPPDYTFESADPDPDARDEGVLTWSGREDFAPERPTARAVPLDSSSTTTESPGSLSASGTVPDWLAGTALGTVAVVAGVAVWVRRHRSGDGGAHSTVRDDSDDGAPEASPVDESPAAPDAQPATQAADEALLSDEDRVRRLVEDGGGRMKQAELADRLGWSASKTSRVVSGMADDGTVRKYRIGRENVVELDSSKGEGE